MEWLTQDLAIMLNTFASEASKLLTFEWYRENFFALLNITMIDIVLAGDNAIVVGALAAGLPPDQRRKVILIGITAALVLRIFFALIVVQLLQIVGLIFAGGLLLLWVSWRFWRELRHTGESSGSPEVAMQFPALTPWYSMVASPFLFIKQLPLNMP